MQASSMRVLGKARAKARAKVRVRAGAWLAAALAVSWSVAPSAVAEMRLEGVFTQGGLVQGYTEPGSEVTLDGNPVRVRDDGRFLLGFGRNAGARSSLVVTTPDNRVQRHALQIGQRTYQVQRINGLPSKMVTPDKEALARIRAEAALVGAARRRDTPRPYFDTGFQWPVRGRITGVYGSGRVLNGQPRQPHYGIDIAAAEGTPVLAPAGGIVSLAHRDMYFSGGTLIIDHGRGLSSTMMHLSRLLVAEGDIVRQGQPVAEVGATGRATGAHLDWRINLFRARLDPELVMDAPLRRAPPP